MDFVSLFVKAAVSSQIPNLDQFAKLTLIDVASVGLTGPVPLLPTVLQTLNIADNEMVGSIPAIPGSVTSFKIYANKLTDSIPSSLPPQLNTLYIGNNNLDGFIPSLPGSLTALTLGVNKLTTAVSQFSRLLPAQIDPSSLIVVGAVVQVAPGDNKAVDGHTPPSKRRDFFPATVTGAVAVVIQSNVYKFGNPSFLFNSDGGTVSASKVDRGASFTFLNNTTRVWYDFAVTANHMNLVVGLYSDVTFLGTVTYPLISGSGITDFKFTQISGNMKEGWLAAMSAADDRNMEAIGTPQ
ncbi:UNVERIFIED_CONTAM: hypothetical protein HDU68_003318 [Siphonaria sp. JEL0065]|nr:hypothetical protein HDU68_003318 [Siphonaria sp. JEL0065]